MQRYIFKNRALFNLHNGEMRHEYIIFNEQGQKLDTLCITPSTARWVAAQSALAWANALDYHRICNVDAA